MTVTGSMLRFAGVAIVAVAVAGCSGLDRANRGGETVADSPPASGDRVEALEGLDLGAENAPTDEQLVIDLETLFDDWNLADIDALFGEDLAGTGSGGTDPATGGGTTGNPGTGSTPPTLPPFDSGSFADLDAALSNLDLELGAGGSGSEGSLP